MNPNLIREFVTNINLGIHPSKLKNLKERDTV